MNVISPPTEDDIGGEKGRIKLEGGVGGVSGQLMDSSYSAQE